VEPGEADPLHTTLEVVKESPYCGEVKLFKLSVLDTCDNPIFMEHLNVYLEGPAHLDAFLWQTHESFSFSFFPVKKGSYTIFITNKEKVVYKVNKEYSISCTTELPQTVSEVTSVNKKRQVDKGEDASTSKKIKTQDADLEPTLDYQAGNNEVEEVSMTVAYDIPASDKDDTTMQPTIPYDFSVEEDIQATIPYDISTKSDEAPATVAFTYDAVDLVSARKVKPDTSSSDTEEDTTYKIE